MEKVVEEQQQKEKVVEEPGVAETGVVRGKKVEEEEHDYSFSDYFSIGGLLQKKPKK